jgi:hypothetical protein
MLKKLMMSAALAATIGAPAMAQSYDPSMGSGNIVPPITQNAPSSYGYGRNAYAYVPGDYTSAYGPIGLPFDIVGALNPFTYGTYAYEPAPYGYHGRRWYRR